MGFRINAGEGFWVRILGSKCIEFLTKMHEIRMLLQNCFHFSTHCDKVLFKIHANAYVVDLRNLLEGTKKGHFFSKIGTINIVIESYYS